MSVTREVQVAIGSEGGKFLVACCIDGRSHILHASYTIGGQSYAPDVIATHSPRHVTHKVEPLSVGRNGWVGKCRQRVVRHFQFRCLAPCCIRTLTRHDGGKPWIVRVRLTLRQIHRSSVWRQATSALVPVCVQLRVYHLWALPFPFVVLLRIEDVRILRSSNTAQLVALRLVTCRGEEQSVVVLTPQYGRIVSPSRVKQVLALNGIVATLLLPSRCLLCRAQSRRCQRP